MKCIFMSNKIKWTIVTAVLMTEITDAGLEVQLMQLNHYDGV